jgi:hypothetical protein
MKEIIHSFNGGEISPALAGRVDLPGMRRSCRRLRNFIAAPTGPAYRRPPLLHAGTALGTRLLPFHAGDGASYQIELANLKLRVWDATAGTLVATLDALWTTAQTDRVQFTQSNDVMWLTHPAVEPQELRREGGGWVLAGVPWAWPPLRDDNATPVTLSADGTTGVVNLTASEPIFTAAHANAYWQISHFRDNTSDELVANVTPPATAVLTLDGLPVADEQFSIGTQVYVWATAPQAPYQVKIEATVPLCRDNAVEAINGTGGGTATGTGTQPHPLVIASDGGSTAGGTKATAILSASGNPVRNTTVKIGNTTYTFWPTTGDTHTVPMGGSREASLANLVSYVNSGASEHPDVVASTALDGKITFTAKVTGVDKNNIALGATGIFSWNTPKLTGGSTASQEKVKITARAHGLAGNDIPLADDMDNAEWKPGSATSVTAGGDELEKVSPGVRIKGRWNFTTLGRWQGTVYIEQKNSQDGWDVIRQYQGRMDTNKTDEGVTDTPAVLRIRVAHLAGAETSDVPQPRFILEAAEALVHGLVQILIPQAGGTVASARVISELHSKAPTPIWREGAFSVHRGFPAAVALHEERLLFGGNASEPQKVWGSAAGDFRNFEETGLADGSWQYPFTSQQANPIRWMSSARGLLIATAGSERVWDSGEHGITPLHPPVQRQLTWNGSEPVQAVPVGDVVLFVQRGGYALLEYGYEEASGSYIAPDLTQLVDHLTLSGFKAVAVQRTPFTIIWAVTHDGQLLACTYARRDEVIAWAPQPVGGPVRSVSVVPGAAGQADEVWIVVYRHLTHRLERLDPGHWTRLHTGGKLWHLDAAAIRTAGPGGVATNLDHLDKLPVRVFADGREVPDRAVIDGTLTVPGATEIIAGVVSPAEFQPALFDFITDTGTSTGRKFVCKQVHLRLYQTRECQYHNGEETVEPWEVPFRDTSSLMESPPPLFNGLRPLQVNGRFMDGIGTVILAKGMHPLNILNLVPEFELYGE